MRIGGYDSIYQYGNMYADQAIARGSVPGSRGDPRPDTGSARNASSTGISTGTTEAGGTSAGKDATTATGQATGSESTQTNATKDATGKESLTRDEKTQVEELEKRDIEVKAHEQAHIAAGGSYVRGGAHFEYEIGPNGEQYATGGEVSIDVSAVSGNPSATISKMQTVIRAALAPADPSGQDRSIAAQASAMANEARSELMRMGSTSQYSNVAGTATGFKQAKGTNINTVA